jgi:hypothetical protein
MNIWQRSLLLAASATLVVMLLIPPTTLATLGGLHVTQGYRSLFAITQPESKLTIDTTLFYAQFLTVLVVTALLWLALRPAKPSTSPQDRPVEKKPTRKQESTDNEDEYMEARRNALKEARRKLGLDQ